MKACFGELNINFKFFLIKEPKELIFSNFDKQK